MVQRKMDQPGARDLTCLKNEPFIIAVPILYILWGFKSGLGQLLWKT